MNNRILIALYITLIVMIMANAVCAYRHNKAANKYNNTVKIKVIKNR